MSAVVADTHTVLWYLAADPRLSVCAKTLLEDAAAIADPESAIEPIPLSVKIALALQDVTREAVPDLPDRVIAATALSMGLPLVTRDRRIVASNVETVW